MVGNMEIKESQTPSFEEVAVFKGTPPWVRYFCISPVKREFSSLNFAKEFRHFLDPIKGR